VLTVSKIINIKYDTKYLMYVIYNTLETNAISHSYSPRDCYLEGIVNNSWAFTYEELGVSFEVIIFKIIMNIY
jgi:hypothetical protein